MSKHTLSVLVENKPGVLARIAALFSRRGFNIDSLAVGPTEHPDISRMTIVVNVEDLPLEQVTKQLNKLVNVIKIVERDPVAAGPSELARAKGRHAGKTRPRTAGRPTALTGAPIRKMQTTNGLTRPLKMPGQNGGGSDCLLRAVYSYSLLGMGALGTRALVSMTYAAAPSFRRVVLACI